MKGVKEDPFQSLEEKDSWFYRLFQIKKGDLPKLMKLWILYVLLSCGTEVAKLIAEILFVSRAGIRWLPSLFVFQAFINTLASVVYVALVKHWKGSSVFVILLSGFGGVMVASSLGVCWTGDTVTYALLFGCAEAGATLLKIHWGIHILDEHDPESAARVFPLLFTGAALGRSVGGMAISGGAYFISLPLLLIIVVACTVPLSVFLLRSKGKDKKTPKTKRDTSPEFEEEGLLSPKKPPSQKEKIFSLCKKRCEPTLHGEDLSFTKTPDESLEEWSSGALLQRGFMDRIKKDFGLLFSSRLLKAMIVSTALMVVLRHIMRYGSLVVLKDNYDEMSLASLLGTYALLANLVGLALQLFFTPRLLKRMGVEAANLIYAASITAGIASLALLGNVSSALMTRFCHSEFKGAVRTPISPIFYFGEPSHRRAEARAFILGGVVPVFTVFSGVALQGATDFLQIHHLAWIGTFIGVLYVAACVWQNQMYRLQIKKTETVKTP